jgi:hypothetical protein
MNSSEEPTALDQLRKAVIQQKMAALPEEPEDSIFHSLHIIVVIMIDSSVKWLLVC